ncbi:MAG TPA: PfkB family carbohydrate kinase [Rectinemataceae bacterium]|nr:PfkB family carbohydrate kinase [Rectinemataceae bacterium]
MPKKFLVVCLNPVIQKTLVFEGLELDRVNRARVVRTDASGKGVNVARVLSQRGAETVHLTQAGGPNRDWFLSLCAADGLAVEWVDSGSEVRFCSTVIDTAAKTATELVEEALPVAPGTEERLLEGFDRLIPRFDVLVISGTKAAGYSDAVIPEMVKRASARGLMTLLDIKGRDLVASLPFRPAVVKPNLSEFLATFPARGGAHASAAVLRSHVQEYARAWKERYGSELVVTRGGATIWFSEDGRPAEEVVLPVEAINPTGSGDSFAAGLAFTLAAGGSLREAIREGARLGALNAANLKPGSIVRENA